MEAILLVLLLATAFLAWRLGQGSLKLDAVAPYVSNAFSELAPGYRFRIENADFRWAGFSGAPELTLRNVRVLNDAEAVIAGLPTMVVRLSVPALKRGIVAPEQVRLSNPIIRFVHRADGSLGLGVEGGAVTPATSAAQPATTPTDNTSSNALAASLISALSRAPGGDNPAGYLDRVIIEDTTLVLVDEVTSRRWLAPDATLNFRRATGEVEIDATLPVTEEGRRWNVTARGKYTAATNELKVDLNVDGFRPSRVAGLSPQLAPLSMIDLLLSGTASASLRLDMAGARLNALQFDVKGQDGTLHLPAPVSQDYSVKSIAAKGSAGANLDQVKFEQFRIELNRRGEATPVITMTGEGKNLTGAPEIDLNFSLAELSLSALKQYWPVGIKPNTRVWIDENLHEGSIQDIRFKLEISGPSMNALDATEARLTALLRGLSVRYMRTMPAVDNTDGVLTIGPGEVVIDITNGQVPDAISGTGLTVPRGKVRMYGLGLGPGRERADIRLNIQGGFGDVMRLVDNPPLGYAKVMGLDAARVGGHADVDLDLDFPLVKDLKFDQLKIGVRARTQNIDIPAVAFGLPLTNGRLDVTLDRAGMDVSGTAVVGDIPTKVKWRENFVGGDFRAQYVLDLEVGNAQRPKIGLTVMPFIPPYIDGVVPAHVVYTIKRDNTRRLEADVDLTQPVMAVPELGWSKEPGRPAKATIEALFTNTRLDSVPNFHVTSGDELDVSGSVTFAEDGKMRQLSIKPSTIGENKIGGEIGIDEAGAYGVDVTGTAFNATHFLRELNRNADPGVEPLPMVPMRLRAKFDRMWLAPDSPFTDVTLDFERDRNGVQNIDFTSTVGGSAPLTLKLAPEAGVRKFKGSSIDGGSVMRAVGLFGDITGGVFDITGEFAPDGTIKGLAQIKDFKLAQAPVLARLLSVASLTGIVDELRGGGISFSTLRVPFSYKDTILTINDGEMYGGSLGLTGEGTYSFATSQMDFDGTLIPAYTFNALLNSLPIIGPLLNGGEKGGGIFAATYSYQGDIKTAQPSVNPLAALAPGFLRHIFDIFKPRSRREVRAPSKDELPADKVPAAAQ